MNAPSEHRLLLIETSGRVGLIGLADGSSILSERRLDQSRRHARDLAPALRDMLAEQSWRPADITTVIVSRGPGSYTGLRVGIMAAKAFAYTVGCPILGMGTFAVIALQAGPGSPIEVIADAQQERVFAQRFTIDAKTALPVAESPIQVRLFSQWLAEFPGEVRITGPGLDPFSRKLPPECQVSQELWQATLESLHRLALARLQRDECDNLWSLEPLYARPSSAEEQWVKLGRS
jgi:tRNA threonylcarbamoyladenosine biosynthesis protein TsaB